MSVRFALALARRELRASARRIGVYMLSISLGVGALVAIHGFRGDITRSVREEAEVMLGADARISSNRPPPAAVEALLDSLAAAGHRSARVTSAVSMVMAARSETVRLLQVRGVEGGYPFYGDVRTSPPGAWPPRPGQALVDPAVLTQLDARVGDSLLVGGLALRVAGTVEDLMGDFALQTAVGPRVWVAHEALAESGLLGFGAIARYETYLVLPEREDRVAVEEGHEGLFDREQVRWTTAESTARRLTRSIDSLGRYLGLVGLAALLLGGVGVASAVHVFVRERRTTVAVLRCLGAGQWSVFSAYLLQAAALGLAGAVAGVVLGLGAQRLLPLALAEVLPVTVRSRVAAGPVLAGLGIGVWVALLFAWLPLLGLRDVPPLRALRDDVESRPRRIDPWWALGWAALAASVVALSLLEAPERDEGAAFAAGLSATIAVLWIVGWVAVRATRRLLPRRAPYPVRQGIANLFRPQNQTVAVTLALGFGVFAVATILQVEASLLADLELEVGGARPNLLLFDIQTDQEAGVAALLPADARAGAEITPLVPARIARINGLDPEALAGLPDGPERWALRREYRNTWRDTLNRSETLVAGKWWDESPLEGSRVSVDAELADDLDLAVGDRITWDLGGRRVETVVASLRLVDWARFEPNFFVVFEPGVLEDAPRSSILVARIDEPEARADLQRRLVRTYPNVSALDVTRIQEAVEAVLARVHDAVRFLGGFCAIAGVLVLAGALATSHYQRVRESALLRTLGARRGQVRTVLLTEYLALGTLASLTGLALAAAAAGALARGVLEVPYVPDLRALAAVWAAVTALTAAVGLAGSRGLLTRPPLPVLRRASE